MSLKERASEILRRKKPHSIPDSKTTAIAQREAREIQLTQLFIDSAAHVIEIASTSLGILQESDGSRLQIPAFEELAIRTELTALHAKAKIMDSSMDMVVKFDLAIGVEKKRNQVYSGKLDLLPTPQYRNLLHGNNLDTYTSHAHAIAETILDTDEKEKSRRETMLKRTVPYHLNMMRHIREGTIAN